MSGFLLCITVNSLPKKKKLAYIASRKNTHKKSFLYLEQKIVSKADGCFFVLCWVNAGDLTAVFLKSQINPVYFSD